MDTPQPNNTLRQRLKNLYAALVGATRESPSTDESVGTRPALSAPLLGDNAARSTQYAALQGALLPAHDEMHTAHLAESDFTVSSPLVGATRESPYGSGGGVEDPLLEWDAATRERVLSNCHAAYQRNPLAHAAVNFTTDFVIGSGFNLVCKHPEVERILKAFIDNPDNAIHKFERQAVNDLQVDGELIVRFFTHRGQTVIVPMRPWELKWIKTEPGFFRRPLFYHFERYQTEGDAPTGRTETVSEDVPADAIHFVAINDHAYELRGRPELYRVLPWLRADKDWLEERARQNRWRNALLWHVRVTNATPGALASVIARWRRPPSPGSAYVSSAAEEVKPLTNPVAGADSGHDGRAIRLMVILGMRLPEYFFGDGSMANLATATRQELPALTKFESFQQVMIEQLWTPIFRRVLQNAIDAGLLPEYLPANSPPHRHGEGQGVGSPTNANNDDASVGARHASPPTTNPPVGTLPASSAASNGDSPVGATRASPYVAERGSRGGDFISTLDAFELSYQPVTTQDVNALANMLNVAVEKGWASNQTAAEKLGFDPTIERTRLQSEQSTTTS